MSGVMKGVLFLAGQTARSQAYAQCLSRNGLFPELSLVYGASNAGLPGQTEGQSGENPMQGKADVFLPNLAVDLKETLAKEGFRHEILPATDVNDSSILAKISAMAPSIVIYSGYGSQLVKKPLLALGIPFLHCHSGWVPDFRGSTTLYYSWIAENSTAVSAIILNEKIDKGDIVARKRYPPPPSGVDPDYVYDTAIRADLLVQVLKDWRETGRLPLEPQREEGNVFYVIHPVLKHLARLRSN